ncbi:hypothetical protein [Micromonospora sp. WMMB482]|uniref:hypothetical protein n=1 Tax=Micromonospora sp. WMMB482 TaxID=2849653 RepID=UPI0027E08AB9|nr:hypothetical protein [Micromonospora sp. WMMB482]
MLTLDGERLNALSVDEETRTTPRTSSCRVRPSHYIDAKISVPALPGHQRQLRGDADRRAQPQPPRPSN